MKSIEEKVDKILGEVELREKLADLQHEIWSDWMKHLFKVSLYNRDRSVTIPSDKVERWKLQMKTRYKDLSEIEKDSDREQADRILKIL